MNRIIFSAACAVTLIAGAPVSAMEPLPDGTTTEERANTARLNAEQRARAEAEIAAYEQQLAAIAQYKANANASFAEQTAAYEAEKAKVSESWNAEQKKWEADAAACKAGDQSRCAPAAPQIP